jgi:hypothetical protein
MIKKILQKRKDKRLEEEAQIKQNRDQIAKALEVLFSEGYIDRKKLYLENFIRGIVFSAGTIIGATVVIALVLWILSLFDQVPLVGPLFENTRETIEQSQNVTR